MAPNGVGSFNAVHTTARPVAADEKGVDELPPVSVHKVGYPRPASLPSLLREEYEKRDPLKKYKPLSTGERVKLFLFTIFPCLGWISTYKRSLLVGDIIGGCTIAIMAIPQDLAYANLAKLPPVNGLYTSWLPPLIYAIWGSSRHIAIGPVAVVSLLVGSLLPKQIDPKKDPQGYLELSFLCTFIVGIIQIGMGVFRLGFLIEFLSHSTIVGFMAAAAITIGMSQLKNLLGYTTFTNNTNVQSVIGAIRDHTEQFNWQTFCIGITFLIFLLSLKELGKRFKRFWWAPALGPLVSLIVSILFLYITRLDKSGVRVVKKVPSGLPPSSINDLHFGKYGKKVIGPAIITAFVALTEMIAIGKTFAAKNNYHINGSQEMFSIGVGNVVGSFSSSFVATGSFSRSAVNNASGGNTQLTGIIMSFIILFTLVVLTPLFFYLPQCVLSVIIMSALVSLVDVQGLILIWKVDKLDFACAAAAFFGTLFKSVEYGIGIAVGVSLVKVILKATRPATNVLGRIPGTEIYRSLKQYPDAVTQPGLLLLRLDAPLFFANIGYLKDKVLQYVDGYFPGDSDAKFTPLQYVILDMSPVTDIDPTAGLTLDELARNLKHRNITLALCNPNSEVIYRLDKVGVLETIGQEWLYVRTHDAVKVCSALVERRKSDEAFNHPEEKL